MKFKAVWQKLPVAYKLFLLVVLFLALVEAFSLLFLWHYESKVLLQKEEKNLSLALDNHYQRLYTHLEHLRREVGFLASLEVMDDIVAKDIDKRIASLLEHKAHDLGEQILLVVTDLKKTVTIAPQRLLGLPLDTFLKHYLLFHTPVFASFDPGKQLGNLVLLYPLENLQHLKTDSPFQKLWLEPPKPMENFKVYKPTNALVATKTFHEILPDWKLHLSYDKTAALHTLKDIGKVQLYTYITAILLLSLIIWFFSKRLTSPLLELLKSSQQALEAKSMFLSTISHELRTPLGSILNLTQHLTLSLDTTPETRKMLNGIETSAQHLLSMINNILQLSKLEANSIHVRITNVSLPDTIEEICEIMEPLIEEKKLSFNKNIEITQEYLITDPNLLKQVMINLLSNAVKFTDSGQISLTLRQYGKSYRFTVQDTGIGIPKALQKQLFTPFFQANRERVREGTGLGLSLSQKVAKLLGGKIVIHSKGNNMGTEAIFIFKSF